MFIMSKSAILPSRKKKKPSKLKEMLGREILPKGSLDTEKISLTTSMELDTDLPRMKNSSELDITLLKAKLTIGHTSRTTWTELMSNLESKSNYGQPKCTRTLVTMPKNISSLVTIDCFLALFQLQLKKQMA